MGDSFNSFKTYNLRHIFYIMLACLLVTLYSCGGTTNQISKGQLSEDISYKQNIYAGCCGCIAHYFDVIKNKTRQEQIIYKYNCYQSGLPTKFIFNYDESGNL